MTNLNLMNILRPSNNCIFFTRVSPSFSVSSVMLSSFKYQHFFLGKSHWNSVREEALWRLLSKCSANRSDSSSTGLNSPSQSCQNVSSLVSPLSFTCASCARSAGRVRVAWWNLAAAGKASVSPGLLCVWRCVPGTITRGWAGGKSEAEWPALISPPPFSVSLDISRAVSLRLSRLDPGWSLGDVIKQPFHT